ncbi:NAD(P)-dependent oxidoreductase [Streptomyces tendae]|uniref:NAD(P)-dependent oxidoreductase n=1 Tax=Streptomyces tendae TaxID=1932 RepID=A0A6B3QPB2_STRTE|nr:NAD-dependent epimerase/dehydratase family protein [Streptomyces sp. SID5914]NEV89946.1 NAD(P)-dependent oxidoreductase [Streptomyces tendae]BET45135.1 UDP-glucose 4-epimerase GalE [Kitasatospora aureofaciens]
MAGAVAVLGGTGCMGRHICAAFAGRGARVVAVSRRRTPVVDAYRFLPMDVVQCTAEELAAVLTAERVDTVVNATLGWGRTEEEMGYTNVRLVERLLDAARSMAHPPRLVHLGTIHEYGPVSHGTLIDEGLPPRPQTLYARAKLTASRMVLDAVRAGLLDGIVLRVTNTIGPYPAPESFFGALAARLRDVAAGEGVELTVADARRDYVDVRDAADAVVRAARSPLADPLVNLGRGEALHIRELVDALVRATGLPPESIRERPGDVAGRSAGADWIRVDNSRAGRLLGWRPRYDVDASMRDLWDTVRPAPPMSSRASSGSPNSATTVLCEVDPARRRRSPGGDGRRRR